MSHLYHLNYQVNNPSLNVVHIGVSSVPLYQQGFNFQLEISTSTSVLKASPTGTPPKSIIISGHFDTGCTNSSIDHQIAALLGLQSIGKNQTLTAAGPAIVDNYLVDIGFPGTGLKGVSDAMISSANLGFNIAAHTSNPQDLKNMGMLIGRDLMQRWSITWHGPTSTVLISD